MRLWQSRGQGSEGHELQPAVVSARLIKGEQTAGVLFCGNSLVSQGTPCAVPTGSKFGEANFGK